MQLIYLFFDILQAESAYAAYGIGKVIADDILIDTDCFEDLRALVGLDRGNSHFGSNLNDSMQNGVVIIFYCCIVVLVEHVIFNEFFHCFMRHVRVNCTCAVAKQSCKVMYFTRLT